MYLYRRESGLEVWAPAKLNLFLEILGKRPDGFHELETLMVPVTLYDTIYFTEERSGRVELQCRRATPQPGEDSEESVVPEGPDNIVTRAVELLRARAGTQDGARLTLVKRIPAAAGLAGGSSDAAAALIAANQAWNLGYSRSELAVFAAELGSDVPFFLHPGAAICRGRGEQIERVAGMAGLSLVIVRPPQGLSTAAVFRACRPASRPRTVGSLTSALSQGRMAEAGSLFHNGLTDAARALSPWISRLQLLASTTDVLGHGLSGSGSCYFALCRHLSHARRVAASWRAQLPRARVYVVRSSL